MAEHGRIQNDEIKKKKLMEYAYSSDAIVEICCTPQGVTGHGYGKPDRLKAGYAVSPVRLG